MRQNGPTDVSLSKNLPGMISNIRKGSGDLVPIYLRTTCGRGPGHTGCQDLRVLRPERT